MSRAVWDNIGEKIYATGVDHGMLYKKDKSGNYGTGVVWNGLTAVTEKPSGAEENKQYADNQKYLSLFSAEDFGATIEAFFSPKEFDECDGTAEIATGVNIGQQNRRGFGFSYRNLLGNDVQGTDYGYEIHIIYNAMAQPTEKSKNTTNESPEAPTQSWEVTTTPSPMPGNAKPAAHLWVNSVTVNDSTKMTRLENILWGTDADPEHSIEATEPRLATPAEIVAIFGAINQQAAG